VDTRGSVAGALRAEPAGAARRYPGLSPDLALGLLAGGGLLAAVGGLGTGVRATESATRTGAARDVDRIAGTAGPWGWVIAAVAVAVLVSLWLTASTGVVPAGTRRAAHRVGAVAAAALAALAAVRLVLLDGQVGALAGAARHRSELDFAVYHAEFAWGAWCLLAGALALALGVLVTVLRKLDARASWSS
jgi:hypothetical protein